VAFRQDLLGVQATFPGAPSQSTFVEENVFGRMQWISFSFSPPNHMDQNFRVDVGSIPPGTQGGDTVPAALASYAAFLGKRLGVAVSRQDLTGTRGPGFAYVAPGARNGQVEGVVVLRRGRIHHAQATVARPGDPRVKAFLDSFRVD
jgi:hypothetical protein